MISESSISEKNYLKMKMSSVLCQTTLCFQHRAYSSKEWAGWGRVSVGEEEEEEDQEDLVAKISCVSKDEIAAHDPTHLLIHKCQQGGPAEFAPDIFLHNANAESSLSKKGFMSNCIVGHCSVL